MKALLFNRAIIIVPFITMFSKVVSDRDFRKSLYVGKGSIPG